MSGALIKDYRGGNAQQWSISRLRVSHSREAHSMPGVGEIIRKGMLSGMLIAIDGGFPHHRFWAHGQASCRPGLLGALEQGIVYGIAVCRVGYDVKF